MMALKEEMRSAGVISNTIDAHAGTAGVRSELAEAPSSLLAAMLFSWEPIRRVAMSLGRFAGSTNTVQR